MTDPSLRPGTPGVAMRILGRVEQRPVASMSAAALAVRLLVVAVLTAAGSFVFTDEGDYVSLTEQLLAGYLHDPVRNARWIGNYPKLRGFVVPLVTLADLFGNIRLVGRLWSALLGAGVVALTVAAARMVATPRRSLLAGLLAMLLPSQVLFSSVVLRESTVWLTLVLLATAVALIPRAPLRTQALLGALAIGALGWLWVTRAQTALVAMTAAAVTLVWTAIRLRRFAVALTVALVLLLVPMLVGAGPAGTRFATRQLGRLDVTRWNMAVGAESAIDIRPTEYRQRRRGEPVPSKQSQVRDALARLPRGLVAVLLRPFPWEPGASATSRAAQLENLLWLPLYLAAALGAFRRRHEPLVVNAVLFVLGVVLLGAVSQGNLGTAYRHRGQLVWALAILAAAAPSLRIRRRRPAVTTPTEG